MCLANILVFVYWYNNYKYDYFYGTINIYVLIITKYPNQSFKFKNESNIVATLAIRSKRLLQCVYCVGYYIL